MSLAGQLTGTEWNAGWKAGPTLAGGKPGVNKTLLVRYCMGSLPSM